MEQIFESLDVILTAMGVTDIILGSLPDKICRWPGVILSIAHQLHQYGKGQKEILK